MCRITPGKRILEVGCGVGMTSWRLAKEYGCYVVGIDLSEEMIAWSEKRASREGVTQQAEFKMADAEQLAFDESNFDIVLCESVTAFPENKQKAVSEYARVAKPGGYVGMNEGTWLDYPPPPDLIEYIKNTMENAEFLTQGGWEALLRQAGLKDLRVEIRKISPSRSTLRHFFKYLGYGLYVGRKV